MRGSSKDYPILYLIVSAADGEDDARLRSALIEIAHPGPGVSINRQSQERFYRLEGRDKSDLESACDFLRDEYKLAINVGSPTAIFLETIRKQADATGKYIRQSGGIGNYAHCMLRIEPSDPREGFVFISAIAQGAVPDEYVKSIEKGVLDAMERGVLAGSPVVDVKVTLYDGSYHEADSNEMAFRLAGSICFNEAARKASPVLLEPMMAVEIEVPAELTVGIRGEVQSHRGRIEDQWTANGFSAVKAIVPLSELLTSRSQRLAEFPMEFVGYEAVLDNGSSDEDRSGVTANKPNDPQPRKRAETSPIEREDS